jgi:hypothetical protein
METTIIVYGNTLSATDYQRVCEAWRQARQPITVQFIFPSAHALFGQDEIIVDGTATRIPLTEEQPA